MKRDALHVLPIAALLLALPASAQPGSNKALPPFADSFKYEFTCGGGDQCKITCTSNQSTILDVAKVTHVDLMEVWGYPGSSAGPTWWIAVRHQETPGGKIVVVSQGPTACSMPNLIGGPLRP